MFFHVSNELVGKMKVFLEKYSEHNKCCTVSHNDVEVAKVLLIQLIKQQDEAVFKAFVKDQVKEERET